jgi:hypothetical protein
MLLIKCSKKLGGFVTKMHEYPEEVISILFQTTCKKEEEVQLNEKN